jgi:hypothetical protein
VCAIRLSLALRYRPRSPERSLEDWADAAMKAEYARPVPFIAPPHCAGLSDNEILVLKTKLFLNS